MQSKSLSSQPREHSRLTRLTARQEDQTKQKDARGPTLPLAHLPWPRVGQCLQPSLSFQLSAPLQRVEVTGSNSAFSNDCTLQEVPYAGGMAGNRPTPARDHAQSLRAAVCFFCPQNLMASPGSWSGCDGERPTPQSRSKSWSERPPPQPSIRV